jgi:hypothetical protein
MQPGPIEKGRSVERIRSDPIAALRACCAARWQTSTR